MLTVAIAVHHHKNDIRLVLRPRGFFMVS